MASTTHWKATVALNVLLCLLIASSYAQSPTLINVKISYSCRAERLETVIDQLSKSTGYDFIYSRDLVDISRTVSLNVKDKSIHEVLSLIEKQVNVSFKLKDHHIIVKNIPKPVVPAKTIAPTTIFASPEAPLITSISKNIPVNIPFESHTEALQKQLDKRINEVQRLLGSGSPRNIPTYYLDQINFNNRHRSWFAAVGTSVTDDGAGFELQAGLSFLYAVYAPRFSIEHGFSGAYGVGNSINIVGNFSFTPIYLYSNRTTSEVSRFNGPLGSNGPSVTRTVNVRQHQIKMTVRYAFSKNLSVRFGPVLNYRNTLKEISVTPGTLSEAVYSNGGYGLGGGGTVIQNRRFNGSSSRLLESWVGWDASIQYRINFFEQK